MARVMVRRIRQESADKKHKYAYEVRVYPSRKGENLPPQGHLKDKFWRKADADDLARRLRRWLSDVARPVRKK